MKQIVRFEVFLSNDDEPAVFDKPTHVFESFFESSYSKDLNDAIFDFTWKVRSFVLSCQDVFKFVSVNKVVTIIDYGF